MCEFLSFFAVARKLVQATLYWKQARRWCVLMLAGRRVCVARCENAGDG